MKENIAERVREDRKPEGEMFALHGEAKRLRSALAVANKWLDAAWEHDGGVGELVRVAETTRDEVEEELSRTAHRMEVLRRRREMGEGGRDEAPEGLAPAAVLSDALLAVYCVLRELPGEEFGGEMPERGRYAQMGALLVAVDAANAEVETLAPRREAGLRPGSE